MALPYENSSAVDKAIGEMRKILRALGCQSFGYFVDDTDQTLLVQFENRGRQVSVKASMRGYAAAWLKKHPYSSRMRRTRVEHEAAVLEVANVAVFSILRDWIKGQVAAIETGVLSFEGAFLGQMLLPGGRTVLEHAADTKLLPPPQEPQP